MTIATFIVLPDYTGQGIRDLKDPPQRADSFNAFAARAGVYVVGQYWTTGSHNGELNMEALQAGKTVVRSRPHIQGVAAPRRHDPREPKPGGAR
jgi:uncharacterized protein with GYD domain